MVGGRKNKLINVKVYWVSQYRSNRMGINISSIVSLWLLMFDVCWCCFAIKNESRGIEDHR